MNHIDSLPGDDQIFHSLFPVPKMLRVLALALCGSLPLLAFAQTSIRLSEGDHARSVAEFQAELNAEYLDPQKSPLPPPVLKEFKELPFFPANYLCYVEARFVADSLGLPFQMPTTRPRKAMYRKYGELHFTLDGRPQRLTVYQSLDLLEKPEYRNYLFLPFSDATNGHGSYGGGRFIDLKRPLGAVVQLDFNRAYNPYCAYSDRYSCPIPPAENHLSVEVRAGVMSDH